MFIDGAIWWIFFCSWLFIDEIGSKINVIRSVFMWFHMIQFSPKSIHDSSTLKDVFGCRWFNVLSCDLMSFWMVQYDSFPTECVEALYFKYVLQICISIVSKMFSANSDLPPSPSDLEVWQGAIYGSQNLGTAILGNS